MNWRRTAAGWKRRAARRMRARPTRSEALLWAALRRKALGVVWRRQVVMRGWIVDFWCPAWGLIVEVDGSAHWSRAAEDARRDGALAALGARTLRVTADDVETRLPWVIARIRACACAETVIERGPGCGREGTGRVRADTTTGPSCLRRVRERVTRGSSVGRAPGS